MSCGVVYALSNPAMPGLIKIGKSVTSAANRAQQLYSSGVPCEFVVEHEERTINCVILELMCHKALDQHRYSLAREFFLVDAEFAANLIVRIHHSDEFPKIIDSFNHGVTQAIEQVGLSQLARECGVSHQAVRKWEKYGIPAERAVRVSEVSGIALSALRPDLWPNRETSAA